MNSKPIWLKLKTYSKEKLPILHVPRLPEVAMALLKKAIGYVYVITYFNSSYLGGSSNSPIYLIGVNSSSGTRMQVENIVGFLGSSVYWASDGVSPYSITNGYPLESMIADLVARRPDAIGYVDYSNYKRCLGSVIAMRYNGVICTTNTVANGSYELWGYARVISLSQMGSLQQQIYDALVNNLNSASFQATALYQNTLVPFSIMQVERDYDYGPIWPFLW